MWAHIDIKWLDVWQGWKSKSYTPSPTHPRTSAWLYQWALGGALITCHLHHYWWMMDQNRLQHIIVLLGMMYSGKSYCLFLWLFTVGNTFFLINEYVKIGRQQMDCQDLENPQTEKYLSQTGGTAGVWNNMWLYKSSKIWGDGWSNREMWVDPGIPLPGRRRQMRMLTTFQAPVANWPQ